MVSTRGIKYKFSEGEKVLCYEPDLTKAKVLYDSKVLEVVEQKDKRGRKSVEYLIHFQGWNSSWDRCVKEDYVLKDTEENRQLQRDLAEKSQLQIGAYLYRKERKKRNRKLSERIHDSLNSGAKNRHGGSSEDGSSGSTGNRDVEDTDDTQQEDGDSETVSCSSMDIADAAEDERVTIELGEVIKKFLEQDHDRVRLKNKLVNLPVSPNVVNILESYVKHFAVSQLCGNSQEPLRKRPSPTSKPKDIDKICRSLNICKEVCDGLRIYFDFILKDHLLYNPEQAQCDFVLNGEILPAPNIPVKSEGDISIEDDIHVKQEEDEFEFPADTVVCSSASASPHPNCNINVNTMTVSNINTSMSGSSPRRLRSHKSSSEQVLENEGVLTDILNAVVVKQEIGASSLASTSSRCSTPHVLRAASVGHSSSTETPQGSSSLPLKSQTVLKQVMQWKLIPDEIYNKVPAAPSLVYGAIHLARLMVKLPEFLQAINMNAEKLKLILKHIDMFVDYLEVHKEWFGDNFYKEAT